MHKNETLNRAIIVSNDLNEIKKRESALREEFLRACYQCHRAGATQQEIADATGFSRQRIGQYLDKRRHQTVDRLFDHLDAKN